MTVKISGNSSSSTPSFAGDDGDSGLHATADQVQLVTNGTVGVTVDSSQNVGIGATSVTGFSNYTTVQIEGGTSAGAALRFLDDADTAGTDDFVIYKNSSGSYLRSFADPIVFFGSSEYARIDTDGRLLVGNNATTSSASTIEAHKLAGGSNVIKVQSGIQGTNELQNGQEVVFAAQGYANGNGRQAKLGVYKHSGITNAVAYIFLDQQNGGNAFLWVDNSGNFRLSSAVSHTGTTSGTVVGTQTSDERLKNVGENVAYGLSEVLQLQPKQYAFKAEPDTNKLGFIAQEVQSIIPEAVFDTKEELEGHQEGDSTKLGMEYVQLIPVLVNAIKEQQAMIETLETVNAEQATTIASFEARISALEGGN